jgi:hypothetical protein
VAGIVDKLPHQRDGANTLRRREGLRSGRRRQDSEREGGGHRTREKESIEPEDHCDCYERVAIL